MRHPPPPALQHVTTVRGAVNARGMPRTCGEAPPPPPALQHVTTVRGAISLRGMPRTYGEASPPPQGGLVWGACSLWLSAP